MASLNPAPWHDKRLTAKRVPTVKALNAYAKTSPFNAVSLFSGMGGGCMGLKAAGFNVRYANEFIPVAADCYDANGGGLLVDRADVRKVTAKRIYRMSSIPVGEVDLVLGSPPCKAFSSAQARKGGSDFGKVIPYSEGVKQRVDDLFFEFCRLLKQLQPKAFLAENVPGLVKAINRGYFVEIHDALTACGYEVQATVIDPSRYGIPQRRNRLIFQGIRNDLYASGIRHAWPKPYEKETSVSECLPHIVQIKTASGFTWANIPCSTITASDHSIGITGDFSAGGFVETSDGVRRKYTIEELKVVSSVPTDFVFPRQPNETDKKHFIRSWERLGRILLPLFAYHLGMAVRQKVIEPYYASQADTTRVRKKTKTK